jgi:hypothetical protein
MGYKREIVSVNQKLSGFPETGNSIATTIAGRLARFPKIHCDPELHIC